ncbi:MAG: hypothetical protein M0Q91_17415 [Methanoregula sp.]|nr:hypothetical protein [Methanoregula sp.]
MTEAERIRRMCGAKRRLSKDQAKAAAHAMNARDPAIKIKAYRCPYCNNWHVGRQRS